MPCPHGREVGPAIESQTHRLLSGTILVAFGHSTIVTLGDWGYVLTYDRRHPTYVSGAGLSFRTQRNGLGKFYTFTHEPPPPVPRCMTQPQLGVVSLLPHAGEDVSPSCVPARLSRVPSSQPSPVLCGNWIDKPWQPLCALARNCKSNSWGCWSL